MDEKLELKEILMALDCRSFEFYDSLSDTQRKELNSRLFTLGRFISNVENTNNKKTVAQFIETVNSRYNKHYFTLAKHPKLLWQLLCSCSDGKQYFHKYMSLQKEKGNKFLSFLLDIYPNKKYEELEMIAKLATFSDMKQLAKDYGYDDKEIGKIFKQS